jgi:hypothetical protein
MLPDYPELKRKLREDLNQQLQLLVIHNAPLVREIRQSCQAEGDRFTYENTEGEHVTKKFREISAEFEVPANLSSAEMNEQFRVKMVEAAKAIAQQSEGMLFSTMEEVTTRVGNTFDARGRPFEPNMLWDMIERMQMDFDEKTGEPKLPTVVLHPDMMKAIAPKIPEWEADPQMQKRRREVLARKKVEWNDRESLRKLVG